MSVTKYNNVAIFLHWVMALAFLAMITSGLVMEYADIPQKLKFNMYQWHKSLGVLLLLAFVLRMSVRIFSISPKIPKTFKPWEHVASKIGHYALYVWMLILPLSGWVMVSSSPYGLPTFVFGWFKWPHIPNIEGNAMYHDIAKITHEYLAYVFIALIVIHIGAVLKHMVVDKHNLLSRIWFSKSR